MIYNDKFLDSRFGITGIREYPSGEFGIGDVDSGPVILQIGAAATIVGMQTFNLFGNVKESSEIRNAIEALGLRFKMTRPKLISLDYCLWPMRSLHGDIAR